MFGGAGDDVLNGEVGFDALDGGDGFDRCYNGENNTNCEEEGTDTVAPTLTITAPTDPVVNDDTPAIVLDYADSESGIDTATLEVFVNAIDVTASCVIGPAQADCEAPALTEGQYTIDAAILDRAANEIADSLSFELILSGECSTGETESCYEGSAGTEGVGECRSGTRTCRSDLTFGPCEGQVTPIPEFPDDGLDQDCDGIIDAGALTIPPDPATVASSIDTTVPTDLFTTTEFLYTGEDPIQTGVDPDTIEHRRVAVIRGLVTNRDEEPIPGVTISILNHPEFG